MLLCAAPGVAEQEILRPDFSGPAPQVEVEFLDLKQAETAAGRLAAQELAEIAAKERQLQEVDRRLGELQRASGSQANRQGTLSEAYELVQARERLERELAQLRNSHAESERRRRQQQEAAHALLERERQERVRRDVEKYLLLKQANLGENLVSAAWDELVASYNLQGMVARDDLPGLKRALGLTEAGSAPAAASAAVPQRDAPVAELWLPAKNGNVGFAHRVHGGAPESLCQICHGASPPRRNLSKDVAHQECKGCHQRLGRGPTKCGDCHKK